MTDNTTLVAVVGTTCNGARQCLTCGRAAVRDEIYCRVCEVRHKRYVPKNYKIVHRRLFDRLKELEEAGNEALSLRDEVHLARAAADQAIVTFGEALEIQSLAATPETKATADKFVSAASMALLEVIKHVRETALDAAKIETLTNSSFSVNTVREIVTQCTRIMHQVCSKFPDGDALAFEFEERIRDEVKVTEVIAGTLITPDQDVLDMDASIPKALP